jgi:hypothetical protein
MIRAIAVVVTVLVTASLGAAGTAIAQAKPDSAQPRMEHKSDTMGQTVEGTIKSVRGNMVTLEDGTELSVSSSAKVTGQLKPGAQITAEYEQRAGQKVARSVQVKG